MDGNFTDDAEALGVGSSIGILSMFTNVFTSPSVRTIGFWGLAAYLFQALFCTVLGVGWTSGYTAMQQSGNAGGDLAPRITLGSSYLHLQANQAISVRYAMTVRSGCVTIALLQVPTFRQVEGSQTEFPATAATSNGILTLVAPSAGWYKVDVADLHQTCEHSQTFIATNSPMISYRPDATYSVSWTDLTG